MARRADHPDPSNDAGLERWLRGRGIRPGPVYTVVQIAVVIAAVILAVLIFT